MRNCTWVLLKSVQDSFPAVAESRAQRTTAQHVLPKVQVFEGEDGAVYVADRLRGVVIGFREDLSLAGEIGAGPDSDGLLAGPANVLLGARGKLYVTQTRGRGISVFATRPS